ncbi:alpha-isopropylmalate synthase regulatory domain-containing protein, partial [Nocardia pseudovaccinii]|uniref:alpha-isopropylmalate synthase regulatory domain-containing protein n=1 Tax=Nocardia pseudovaccinii TaxID=189540 RepID=UPI000A86A605
EWRTTDGYTEVTLSIGGVAERSEYRDIGPVEALTAALARVGHPVEVLGSTQQSLGTGDDGSALTYLEYRIGAWNGWACGRGDSVLTASLAAVIRAANAIVS